MTLTIDITGDLEIGLRAAAGREGLPLDNYVRHLIEGHLRATDHPAGDNEVVLLQQVNLGLSDEAWHRFRTLSANRRAETLSSAEQVELIRLSDELEQANARRIAALAKLAELRCTTLDALMAELDIPSPGIA